MDFTRDDVERGGWAPWTTSRKFGAELDTDDMADTAAAYLRAASEVSDVGGLSRRATELAADAGCLDGDALVDTEGRIRATDQALGEDGVDGTVRLLVRTMNQALKAGEEVAELVHGGGRLDERFANRLEAARGAYQDAVSQIAALNADIPPDKALLPPWPVTTPGYSFTVEATGGAYTLPATAADGIRRHHLTAARQDAAVTGKDIADTIEVYRRGLTAAAAELDSTYGFDLTGGPLRLWTTPDMAIWAAEGLKHPGLDDGRAWNVEDRLRCTEGLDAIVRSVFGTSGDPGAPVRDMTGDERAYLLAFYKALGQETDAMGMSALSPLSGPLAEPGDEGRRTEVFQRLANGVNMLLDPEIGGIDPRDPDARDDLPGAVRRFVYDEPRYDWSAEPGPGGVDAHWRAMEDLRLFGDLMGTASVGPGEHFGRDLAGAAVRIQDELVGSPVDWAAHDLPRPGDGGPEGMLRAVSENGALSAALLADESFRDGLLHVPWEEGVGPGLLVENGTTLPPGVEPGSAAARPYERAAEEFAARATRGDGDGWTVRPGAWRLAQAVDDVVERAGAG
ncbi:hypothetical protein ACL02R_21995 [Streptomyces sp. MS19]|uniref:TPR repeat region-containing protein n=1 Tax=Streptomyces sp. MS19 TaxID=3385972 RepID=UPI0039A2626D